MCLSDSPIESFSGEARELRSVWYTRNGRAQCNIALPFVHAFTCGEELHIAALTTRVVFVLLLDNQYLNNSYRTHDIRPVAQPLEKGPVYENDGTCQSEQTCQFL